MDDNDIKLIVEQFHESSKARSHKNNLCDDHAAHWQSGCHRGDRLLPRKVCSTLIKAFITIALFGSFTALYILYR